MRRTVTNNRSRTSLQREKHILSGFLKALFSWVIAPHHPHLNIVESVSRKRCNPQPQHVVSWSSDMDAVQCPSYIQRHFMFENKLHYMNVLVIIHKRTNILSLGRQFFIEDNPANGQARISIESIVSIPRNWLCKVMSENRAIKWKSQYILAQA